MGKVITHEMHRNKMGNRVSKSKLNFVKEQRADGSWLLTNNLRCALLVFESNYIAKIHSNRFLTMRSFSSNHKKNDNNNFFNSNLSNFITGLTDAEGSFIIQMRKMSALKTGWAIEPSFEKSLHLKDLDLLNLVRKYFGNISKVRIDNNKQMCHFSVRSLNDTISNILPHFDNYPLLTQKRADYLLFKKVILMMQNKEHLTKVGIDNIVNIRASMNLGLTDILKAAFPNYSPILRPIVEGLIIPNPLWVVGFVSGEGCFFINLITNKYYNKTYVQLRFSISQNIRDIKLIESFISYFNCGYITKDNVGVYFNVVKFSDIYEKIIPFFKTNQIIGVKSLNFNDWCAAAEIVKQSKHLTEDGLNQIIRIKQGMNSKR